MKTHLQDAIHTVEETKELGQNTLEELFSQTNQMDDIDSELKNMEGEMERSAKVRIMVIR